MEVPADNSEPGHSPAALRAIYAVTRDRQESAR